MFEESKKGTLPVKILDDDDIVHVELTPNVDFEIKTGYRNLQHWKQYVFGYDLYHVVLELLIIITS
jgi:hypothetical protein